MSEIALEMKDAITSLGGDRNWFDTRQSWLGRAATAAGISYRSAYALFYVQGHEPRASTVEKVRRAVQRRKQEEADARADTRDVLDRLAALERRLCAVDPDFYREHVEALRSATHSDRP